MKNEQPWMNWEPGKINSLRQDFLSWYEREQRNLPWRANQDPYRIWISEIMLQQTRVDTVIDYFYRFMEWFPTIEALAAAPEERLLKAWEGLGYYSRARNLKTAAQQIVDKYHGQMPADIEEIRTLKGIGPYTAGAIGSIAFQLPEPAIDGNVMRVVSRLFEIKADIAKAGSRKIFDSAMRQLIDPKRPGDFNQAMMDLGSAICTPTSPKCPECPLQAYCLSYQKNTMTSFPVKTKKTKPKDVYYISGIIENKQQAFLLNQRAAAGLLAGMWTFPLIEVTKAQFDALEKKWSKEDRQLTLDFEEPMRVAEEADEIFKAYPQVVWQKRSLGVVTHIFSHLKWHVLVFYGRQIGAGSTAENQRWVKAADFSSLVFPKPQQKMLELYQETLHKK